MSNIHVNNSKSEPQNDTGKLHKLQRLIEDLDRDYMKLCNVFNQISIKENMISVNKEEVVF